MSRWVPAEAVPLWLVKAFEERARTEAAERGAGASGAAGGSCAIVRHSPGPAAAAAGGSAGGAAAAASGGGAPDACLVCGLTLAETFATCPGLAAAGWVSCASASASCLAGCHAACLGLTPREAEGPAASRAKWLCE